MNPPAERSDPAPVKRTPADCRAGVTERPSRPVSRGWSFASHPVYD